MTIELQTPYDIIETLTITIEKTRKKQKLRQKDIAQITGVPLATYQKFIYHKQISLTALIKIMYALNMMENLQGLIAYPQINSLEEIRQKQRAQTLPKRIRISDETD